VLVDRIEQVVVERVVDGAVAVVVVAVAAVAAGRRVCVRAVKFGPPALSGHGLLFVGLVGYIRCQ
jgi:hypothetical protein